MENNTSAINFVLEEDLENGIKQTVDISLTVDEKELLVAYATKYKEPLTHLCHKEECFKNPLSEKLLSMGLLKKVDNDEFYGLFSCEHLYKFSLRGVILTKKILNIQ